MVVLTVMYGADAKFDHDYYLQKHIPLVRSRWAQNLSDVKVLRGVGAPDGSPALYQTIAILTFNSIDDMQKAAGGEHAAEVSDDIANFTDKPPTIQINELLS